MTIDTADSTGAETQPGSGGDEKRRRKGILRRRAAAPTAAELARPKRRGRRKWVAAGLAVVLLAGGGGAWALTRGGKSAAAPTSRTITETLSTGDVSKTVAASGTVEAANVADLTFPSAGTVNAVKVTVGETVTKGQALASIDTTSLALAVSSAQASYNQSAAQLSSAKANLSADQAALTALRATATTSTGSTGSTGASGSTGSTGGTGSTTTAAQLATEETNDQAQIDSADAQIAADESSLSGAQDKLNSAKADLAGATITSPISGVVSAVNISVGDSVSGSGTGGGGSGSTSHGTGSSAVSASSSTSSSAAIEVVNEKAWVINATVSGADLDSIKVGQEATITTTGATTPVYGTVQAVGVTASSTSGGAATFPVTIDVTGDPTTLHPGDTATVAITTQQLSNVLTVPTAAIRTVNGQTVVTKLVNGVAQTVPVGVGASYGQQTVVTSGLASGDQVQFTITSLAGNTKARTGTGRTGTGTGRTGTGAAAGGGFGGGTFTGGGFGGFGGGAQ